MARPRPRPLLKPASARLRTYLRGFEHPELAPRPTDPLQQPTWFFPDLPSRPFPDARSFGWIPRLERAAPEIRRELFALLDLRVPDRHRAHALVEAGGWNELDLFNRGRPEPSNVARCPSTVRIVESIPGATSAGRVYFSLLEPRTRVRRHAGPVNTRWRCHLGLVVARGAELIVAGQRRAWREGRCLLFDDSFVHAANNASDTPRAVLIVDVWHPGLDAPERAAITAFFDARAGHRPQVATAVGALFAFSAAGTADSPITKRSGRGAGGPGGSGP